MLRPYNYLYSSPVVIDGCPNCNGVFVEDHELTEIKEWLDKASGIEPSATMKARSRLKGGRKQRSSAWNEGANVESLVQALQHWREEKKDS